MEKCRVVKILSNSKKAEGVLYKDLENNLKKFLLKL